MSAPVVSLGKVYCDACKGGDAGGLTVWEFSFEANRPVPAHEHCSAYVCFLVRGDFIETDARDERAYSRAPLVYLPKGQAHAARIGPGGATMIGFELKDSFFDDDVRETALPQRPAPIHDRRLFNLLHATAADAHMGAAGPFDGSWPYEIVAALAPEKPEAAPPWLSRLRDYIHVHAQENPSPARLAAIAGRHPTHMMRVFKRQMGATIGEYIHAVKIDRACRLIRAGRLSLTQIASVCGFADQSHFLRSFRRSMGAAPSDFRRSFE